MATGILNLPDLLEDGFRKVFHDGFGRFTGEVEEVFHMNTSSKPNENDTRIGTLGLFPTLGDGDGITYDDPPQGFDVQYDHLTYAMGFQVTQRMREDDQYRIINRMPDQLGISLGQTVETDGASDLNNGFTAGFTGGDGIVLFSASHPLPGGGTESNIAATPADLDMDSYEQALLDIAATVDDRGKNVNLRPARLFHHRNNGFAVTRLFGSDKDPDTANNAVNPASGGRRGIRPVELNFLTDTRAWFVQAETHFMEWFWRIRPEFGRENDFETYNWKFKGRARWSHGWSDFYGMYGNAGGGS